MKTYIGTKLIKAKPLNLGDYNTLKGWTIPENENPLKEGYLVEYNDTYISWSPKDTFEESYKEVRLFIPTKENMQPHQQRVIDEAIELNIKLEKLDPFIKNNPIFKTLDIREQQRLTLQFIVMMNYLIILIERIEQF